MFHLLPVPTRSETPDAASDVESPKSLDGGEYTDEVYAVAETLSKSYGTVESRSQSETRQCESETLRDLIPVSTKPYRPKKLYSQVRNRLTQ